MEDEALSDALDRLNAAGAALRDAQASVERLAGPHGGGASVTGIDPFVLYFAVFVLAVVVGASLVRSATPAIQLPLMALAGALSSIVIVGGLFAVGISATGAGTTLGFLALVFAGASLFGGFVATRRLLAAREAKDG